METKKVFVALIVVNIAINIFAQGTFQDAYRGFKRQAQTNYEDFRRKANLEYAEWMRKAWEWHDKIDPMPRPKDNMLPPIIFNREKQQNEPKPIPYEDITPPPHIEPQPQPVSPIRENDGDYQMASFTFYGTIGYVRLPKDFNFKLKGKDEEAYASAWEELSSDQYDNLIRDCLVLRMKHQLCDWAYLMMLGNLGEKVCGEGTNEATMMQAFIFCQSGYKIRLGFTKDNDLRLLIKSEHLIYDLAGIRMEDGIFYLFQPIDNDGLSVCDISYPEERPLSLCITQKQLFAERPSPERHLIPTDSMVVIKSQVNENLIHFFASYPTSMVGEDMMSRWAMYANTPLAENVKQKLYPQLTTILNLMDENGMAAEWLLYWVQTAFIYEYDDKVWGHDRAFFAEETLYYPYCDCEDRAILFTRLIRDLLGYDALLVYYPGHLASAVAFDSPIEGDYIEIEGRRYTICDPTYIGAPIGVSMPDLDNTKAKVILLK